MLPVDPRFLRGVDLFNEGEYFDASELFEELFFEAIRDEVEFVRVFLQISVGLFHVEMKQWRPAAERLAEAVRAIEKVENDYQYDLQALRADVAGAIEKAKQRQPGYFSIRRRP